MELLEFILTTTYTVFRKNTHSHFLSYLRELFVDLNINCSEYTQGMVDFNNVVTDDIIMTSHLAG